MILRLVFFAGLAVFAAMLVPKVAPDFLAGLGPQTETVAARDPDVAALRDPGRQVRLAAGQGGHFFAKVRINGRPADVMVDTGATIVAIDSDTARRLGIVPAKSAYNQSVATANGIVAVAPVTLSEIRLGDILVRNVKASVIPADALDINLLGMSFLSRLSKFQIDDGELLLTQ